MLTFLTLIWLVWIAFILLDGLPLADQLKRVLYQRLDVNSTVTFDKVRITIERIEE